MDMIPEDEFMQFAMNACDWAGLDKKRMVNQIENGPFDEFEKISQPGTKGLFYGLDGRIYGIWPAEKVLGHMGNILFGTGEKIEGIPGDAAPLYLNPKAAKKISAEMKTGATHLQEIKGICMRNPRIQYLQTGGLDHEETLDSRLRKAVRLASSITPDTPYEDPVTERFIDWYLNSKRHDAYRLASDACSMIAASRIEGDDGEKERIDSCVVYSKDGFLFDAISGIIIVADDEGNITRMTAIERYVPGFYNIDNLPKDNVYLEAKNELRSRCIDFIIRMKKLAKAENSPVKVLESEPDSDPCRKQGVSKEKAIHYRTIYLGDRYRSLVKKRYSEGMIDQTGKQLATVFVSGFLRQQAYGPRHSLRKEIWIDGFSRGQWVNSGLTVITVK